MFLLYDLLISAALAVLVPWYWLRRACGGKARHGIRERLALYPPDRFASLAGRPVIWLHAVSVGETRAAIPLIRALRQAFPDHALLLSQVTETGRTVAESITEIDERLFFPADHSRVMRRAFDQVRPRMVVIVETEIWPNFVRIAAERQVPVVLVNGRISDRSFPRYRRLRFLLRPVLEMISGFAMQSQEDARRIAELGAASHRVTVTGNLKFDLPASLAPAAGSDELRHLYKLPTDIPVWVAGSTHAGEEEAVLAVFRALLDQGVSLVLVLVPRHPERCAAVLELLTRSGYAARRRSQLAPGQPPLSSGEILLGDTLGEMLRLYAAADVVFVGGSLLPVGGHNILEASLVQRPVLFGPYMHNFREIAQLVVESGAGRQVADTGMLQSALLELLADPAQAGSMGRSGKELIARHAGATTQTVELLRQTLGEGRG